jgi:hypothetical protein
MVALVAWADIPPRDTGGCRGDAKAGAACKTDDGKAGTCATSTCSRKKYVPGQPLTFVNVDCLKCVVGAADAGAK